MSIQVIEPVPQVLLEDLEAVVQKDVLAARRSSPNHGPGNMTDPAGYSPMPACLTFCKEVSEGTIAGGHDKPYPQT